MKNNVPYYFHTKHSLWILVLATTVFTELFILIFQPFESRTWAVNDMQYLRWVTIVVLVAMAVITVSRLVMCRYVKRHEMSYLSHGTWILCEMAAMATIYTVFPFVVLPEYVEQHHLTFFEMYRQAILYTAFIILIPYTIVYLIIDVQEKNRMLAALGEETQSDIHPAMLNFYDDKGELKLSLKPEMVYFIISEDNYVSVNYLNAGKVTALLIRNSLKNYEATYTNKYLVRCHRSYMVNLKQVKMLRREDGEVKLDFGLPSVPPIPVGRAYVKTITEYITSNFN